MEPKFPGAMPNVLPVQEQREKRELNVATFTEYANWIEEYSKIDPLFILPCNNYWGVSIENLKRLGLEKQRDQKMIARDNNLYYLDADAETVDRLLQELGYEKIPTAAPIEGRDQYIDWNEAPANMEKVGKLLIYKYRAIPPNKDTMVDVRIPQFDNIEKLSVIASEVVRQRSARPLELRDTMPMPGRRSNDVCISNRLADAIKMNRLSDRKQIAEMRTRAIIFLQGHEGPVYTGEYDAEAEQFRAVYEQNGLIDLEIFNMRTNKISTIREILSMPNASTNFMHTRKELLNGQQRFLKAIAEAGIPAFFRTKRADIMAVNGITLGSPNDE